VATISGITTEEELRELIGSPAELVVSKIAPRLNDLTRQFVERSPFMCLATSAPDGSCDVSPRGDPAGFVRILDERTLLIPDRPGNRIADSLRNILANPHVGLLFLIPGVGDTFRVNGRATLVTDEELLAGSEVEGKAPKLGILVEIDECYTQCSKALIRSDLWNPEQHVDRSELPSSGEIFRAVREDPEFDADQYDRERAERYARREGLY
jgi:PPOX class probable FMN-dependent enzyme